MFNYNFSFPRTNGRLNNSVLVYPTIEKALKKLEKAKYAEYFDEMDKIEIPKLLKPTYERIKTRFINSDITITELNEVLLTLTNKIKKSII
jgi:hypothetical protein